MTNDTIFRKHIKSKEIIIIEKMFAKIKQLNREFFTFYRVDISKRNLKIAKKKFNDPTRV